MSKHNKLGIVFVAVWLLWMLHAVTNTVTHSDDDELLDQLQRQLSNSWQRQQHETLLVGEAIVAEHARAVTYLAGKRVDMADVQTNVRAYTGQYIEFNGTVVNAALDLTPHNPLSETYAVSGEFMLLTDNGVRVKAYLGMLPGDYLSCVLPVPWWFSAKHREYIGRYIRCKGVVLDTLWLDDWGRTPALLFTGVGYQ